MEEKELSQLLQVRRDKLTDLQNEGLDPFVITKFNRTHTSAEVTANYTTEEREIEARGEVKTITAKISPLDGETVTVAGRIMSKRGMGKVGFVHIQDIEGQVQLFVKKDILGEEEYNRFKKLDIGDIVGATGEVFTTQTGEISIGYQFGKAYDMHDDGYAVVVGSDKKYAIIDREGNYLTTTTFDGLGGYTSTVCKKEECYDYTYGSEYCSTHKPSTSSSATYCLYPGCYTKTYNLYCWKHS